MDVAYISALSALAGSAVGGLTTGVTTWLSQLAQARAGQRAHQLSRREELYRDFIIAASNAYGEAITSNEPKVQEIVTLYAMISRMRILSSPETIACADRIMLRIMDTYFAPNKTIPEIRDMMKDGADIDLLKDFALAARDEAMRFPAL